MADERYVNPAADAGGDGTTAALSSGDSTHAYQSLNIWESTENANITTILGGHIVHCDTTGVADTGGICYVIGWTTDADHPITIQVDSGNRGNGSWDTSAYRLSVTDDVAMYLREEFVNVYGLQIESVSPTAGAGEVFLAQGVGAGSTMNISHCIFKMHGHADYQQSGVKVADADITLNFWNNLIFNGSLTRSTSHCIDWGDGTGNLYNNTIVEGYVGVVGSGGDLVLKNNLVNDCGVSAPFYDAGAVFNAASTRNIADDDIEDMDFGVVADSGTCNTNAINHVIQTGQNFLTTVKVGMVVKNTTDTTFSYVTVVNSDTNLTCAGDVCPDGDEEYTIYENMFGAVVFENAAGDDFHLNYTDTVATSKGACLDADSPAVTDDIEGDSRHATAPDIGYDEYAAIPAGTAVLVGSRIANATRTWQENEGVDVTGWAIADDFIFAAAVETEAGKKANKSLNLRWRNKTDAGAFADLGVAGELTFVATTDLVDLADVTEGEAGCTPSGAQDWQDGTEREGGNTVTFDTGSNADYWSEYHWAVDCSGANIGDEYEFEIYNLTDAISLGTCAVTITMAGAPPAGHPYYYREFANQRRTS